MADDNEIPARKYESPRITVIDLRPEEAVLGICKSATTFNQPNLGAGTCVSPSGCMNPGS